MSDTDSAVLTKPLPDHLVGDGLGQMKLECDIKEGIFIRKKLYYLLTHKNGEIIKSSGIDSSKLNYNIFLNLLSGKPAEISRKMFRVGCKDLTINVVNSNVTIQGLVGNVKTIYNSFDSNFKFISFPIKYNIIIHPLFPLPLIKIFEPKKEIKIKQQNIIPALSKFEHFISLFILFFMFTLIIVLLFKLVSLKLN